MDFSLILSASFQTTFCHPNLMSFAAALCSFTSYEPWTKKDLIPPGRGRKRIWLFSSRRVWVYLWTKTDMPTTTTCFGLAYNNSVYFNLHSERNDTG